MKLVHEHAVGSTIATTITTTASAHDVKASFILNTRSTVVADPTLCANSKSGTSLSGTRFSNSRGKLRFDGRSQAAFTTILPPNSASCAGYSPSNNAGTTFSSDDYYFSAIASPTSYHSGGVNLARIDGSITFVGDTIDYNGGTAAAPTTESEESPYGVWGAFGSKSGGETKAL